MLSFDIIQYELLKAMLDKSSIIIAHLSYIHFQAFEMVVFIQWSFFCCFLHHVVKVCSNVSEKHTALIFRVTKCGSQKVMKYVG